MVQENVRTLPSDAEPFSIEKIVLKKYEDDWTLFFFSNNDTTGGIVINKSSGKMINELLDYAEHNQLFIEYNTQRIDFF